MGIVLIPHHFHHIFWQINAFADQGIQTQNGYCVSKLSLTSLQTNLRIVLSR